MSQKSIRSDKELSKILKGFLQIGKNDHSKLFKYLEQNELLTSTKELQQLITLIINGNTEENTTGNSSSSGSGSGSSGNNSLNIRSYRLFQFIESYFTACRTTNVNNSSQQLLLSNNNEQSIKLENQMLSTSISGSANKNLSKNSKQRFIILKNIIKLIFEGQIDRRTAKDGLTILFEELDYLPDKYIASLCDFIVQLFRELNNSSDMFMIESDGSDSYLVLEIWSQCISTVMAKDEIEIIVGKGKTTTTKEISTDEFKTQCIKSICSVKWDASRAIEFANMFKDMALTEIELETVINKLLLYLNQIQVNDAPSFIYQLMLLSSKGMKRNILEGVIDYFDGLEKGKICKGTSEDAINQIEGTVLHFIDYVTKQNQDLAKEYLKLVKEDNSLNSFKISFLLVISDLKTFEDKVFKLLKTVVDDDYKNATRLHFYIDKEESELLSLQFYSSKLILDTIKKCSKGRDFMVKSIVEFACYLLDSAKVAKQVSEDVLIEKTEAMHCHELGIEILDKLFEINNVVRGDVLSRIFNRVVTNYGNIEKYIELLRKLSFNQTSSLINHISKFKETIEYLSTMTPELSTILLESVQPLYKASQEFQDQVVLVLRKAMYSRELDSRLVALNGFLQILKSTDDMSTYGGAVGRSNVGSSSSSSSSSSSFIQNNDKSNAIDFEIIGFLRRCLSQQMLIRKVLYKGLYEVTVVKPELAYEIVPILLEHLKKYFSIKDNMDNEISISELFLTSCIDNNTKTIIEPLPDLLFYLSKICDREENFFKETYNILLAIVEYLHGTNTETFNIEESSNFDESEPEGRVNKLIGCLYAGCCEALCQFALLQVGKDPENLDTCLPLIGQLHENFDKVYGYISKKTTTSKKKKSAEKEKVEKIDISLYLPELDLEYASGALSEVTNQDWSGTKEEGNILHSVKYHTYLIKLALKRLTSLKKDKKKPNIEKLCSLGFALLKYAKTFADPSKLGQEEDKSDKKKKEKLNPVLAAEVFEEVITLVNRHLSKEEVINFFCGILNTGLKESESNDERLCNVIAKFEKMSSGLITNIKSYDVAAVIVKILTKLTNLIEKKSEIFNHKHKKWIETICNSDEYSLSHGELSKSLIYHLGMICFYLGDLETLSKLAEDVHTSVGDIETDTVGKQGLNYSLVLDNATSSAEVLINCLNLSLEDVEWKFNRIQSMQEKKHTTVSNISKKKIGIYKQANALIEAIRHLVCSKLNLDTSDKLFITLIKFFTLIAEFTDGFLKKFNNKSSNSSSEQQIPKPFQELVANCGNLTSAAYLFINYHNEAENKDKVTSTKLAREAKNIPELIYRLEDSEQKLILLSKKSEVNMMQNYKRSQARSFKIHKEMISVKEEEEATGKKKKKTTKRKKKDEEEDDEEEENEEEKEEDEEENNEDEEEEESSKKKKSKKKSSSSTTTKRKRNTKSGAKTTTTKKKKK
ncbi:hypothetical protein ABK040_011717 [Willaertia magna]